MGDDFCWVDFGSHPLPLDGSPTVAPKVCIQYIHCVGGIRGVQKSITRTDTGIIHNKVKRFYTTSHCECFKEKNSGIFH